MSTPERITRPIGLLKDASIASRSLDPAERENLARVLLIFFVGLVVLLSINFATAPPTFDPMVLLFGLLVASIIWFARRLGQPFRKCPSCTRTIPGYSVFCPICGHRLP